MHPGRGLLGDSLDVLRHLGVPAGLALLDRSEEVLLFLARRVGEEARILLRTLAEVDEERRVAAIVEDHVGPLSIAELEDPVNSQYSWSDSPL